MGFIITNKINIILNEEKYTYNYVNLSLNDIINDKKPFYVKNTHICIIRKKNDINKKNDLFIEYEIITTKGSIFIELKKDILLGDIFEESISNIKNVPVLIDNDKFLYFESINIISNLKKTISSEYYEYNKYEVILTNNSSDENFYNLIFCKKDHNGLYGNPKNVVIANIIGGYENLEKLKKGDFIKEIKSINNYDKEYNIIYTNDLSLKLNDDDKIYTYAKINLFKSSPNGSELVYSLIKNNTFSIDTKTNSFCSDNTFISEPCEYELFESRSSGYVSIRTYGSGRSRIYVYIKDRTSSLAHSIVGIVSFGLDLFKYSKENTKISIILVPERLDILSKSLKDTTKILNERNIKYKLLSKIKNDEDIIVDYYPQNTVEIINQKKIELITTPKENIFYVKFYYDKAPKTVDFFKHSINLKTKKLGILNLSMSYDTTYIFKSSKNAEKYKEIMPENTPKDIIYYGEIGITNQSAKRVGYIGVRLEDNNMFGPTGEKFNATNIIGKFLNPEKLKDVSENDIIYIQEKSD